MRLRSGDKRPTQTLSMELRTHAHDMDFEGVRCVPLEGEEALRAAFVFRHEHRKGFDVAPVRGIRIRNTEPAPQGSENFGANCAFVERCFAAHLADLWNRRSAQRPAAMDQEGSGQSDCE